MCRHAWAVYSDCGHSACARPDCYVEKKSMGFRKSKEGYCNKCSRRSKREPPQRADQEFMDQRSANALPGYSDIDPHPSAPPPYDASHISTATATQNDIAHTVTSARTTRTQRTQTGSATHSALPPSYRSLGPSRPNHPTNQGEIASHEVNGNTGPQNDHGRGAIRQNTHLTLGMGTMVSSKAAKAPSFSTRY